MGTCSLVSSSLTLFVFCFFVAVCVRVFFSFHVFQFLAFKFLHSSDRFLLASCLSTYQLIPLFFAFCFCSFFLFYGVFVGAAFFYSVLFCSFSCHSQAYSKDTTVPNTQCLKYFHHRGFLPLLRHTCQFWLVSTHMLLFLSSSLAWVLAAACGSFVSCVGLCCVFRVPSSSV